MDDDGRTVGHDVDDVLVEFRKDLTLIKRDIADLKAKLSGSIDSDALDRIERGLTETEERTNKLMDHYGLFSTKPAASTQEASDPDCSHQPVAPPLD